MRVRAPIAVASFGGKKSETPRRLCFWVMFCHLRAGTGCLHYWPGSGPGAHRIVGAGAINQSLIEEKKITGATSATREADLRILSR